ncbi:MAG: ISNCY family transposase [Deltaproteobacteria bacterium]|nr:ISNCY family transposase [Deltaproteobacteria bacterium]
MKAQEVILKAVSGEIKWIQAADILVVSPRTMRRKYRAYQVYGIGGLLDQRTCRPSRRRVPYGDVEKVLQLYRESYFDFNVKHFHEKLEEDHGITYSYTWVKDLLQRAGMVRKGKGRGGHRKRRGRRVLFGQMVHLDGSQHEWLSLRPGEKQVLLLVIDDATGRNLGGRLVGGETTRDCMALMREVVESYGIPAQLYTDRGSVFWHTKTAGGKVDRNNLTQFGRAMSQLGVEMIPGYSPQARGRGERWNGTWQGRLVAELRKEGIDNTSDANQYIQNTFIPDMNRRFTVKAAEQGSAFVSANGANLDRIFAIIHEKRKVAADNTVRVNSLVLQIEKSPYRTSFTKCNVHVYEHLDNTYTVTWKKRIIGKYDKKGKGLYLDGGPAPQTPRGLSLSRIPDEQKEKRQGEKSPCPSVYPPASALGSLHSVALSSEQRGQP